MSPSADLFDPEGVTWTPVSPKLIVIHFITNGIGAAVLLLIFAVTGILTGDWWWWIGVGVVLLEVVWLLWLIPRRVRAWGYTEHEDDLLIRRGVMFRTLVVVPYGRMQYVDVQAGPLDRAFGLARVQLHTASPGTDAAIPGLVADEAARLRQRLASRGEARLAGL